MDHERAIQNLAAESYLLDEMTPGEREAFEAHYFECPSCAEDVREALQFLADAGEVSKEVLKSEPVRPAVKIQNRPPKGRPKAKWFAWLEPQFAGPALALLAAVCIVETVAIPSLWRRLDEATVRADKPRIAGSAYLKPQTRGTPTILKAVPGQPMILMFDPPESTARELQVVVKSADGKVRLQLSTDAPAAGEPVTLSIPKLDFEPGSYMLVVTAAAATGQYPFNIQLP